MSKDKILINASNLHSGGGVQVAVSFLRELVLNEDRNHQISLIVSSEIDKNLKKLNVDKKKFGKYVVYDFRPAILNIIFLSFFCSSFDKVFTIFGPSYIFGRFEQIVGFAQAWILHPSNESYKKLNLYEKIKSRIKFLTQYCLFSRYDILIVELESVAEKLRNKFLTKNKDIRVVWNCCSHIFFEENMPSKQLRISKSHESIVHIGALGRNYPHKNMKIFEEVCVILSDKYNVNCKFFVTFNHEEWVGCSENFKKNIINYGSIDVDQCPEFYKNMDIIVCPSVLECFSVTPIEAMAMRKLLIVSDMDFNREICKDFAIYFNPMSPDDLAEKINCLCSDLDFFSQRLDCAQSYVKSLPNYKDRANDYLDLIFK